MMVALRYGIWIWCILAVPTMLSWFESPAWLVFMGFSGLALVLLTSQKILGVLHGGQKRKAPGVKKEEAQLD